MAYQPVDIGAAPNDGTGDPIRDAFDKVNDNFVELYGSLAGLLDFQGATDCSANPNYPAASQGDIYIVSVAGKIGGASGKVVEVGDFYLALADNAGGTEASVGTSWAVLQANITGGSVIAELDDVPDVNAPTPAAGDVLTWDDTPGEWVAAAPAGAGAFVLDDATDVDTTGQTSGDVLTYDGAEWVPQAPSGGAAWALAGAGQTATGVYDFAVDGAKANIDFTGLAGFTDVLLIARAATQSVSGTLALRASVDNGSSFYSASGDYVILATTGAESNSTAMASFIDTNATAARSGVVALDAINVSGTHKAGRNITVGSLHRLFVASTSPINAVRVYSTGGGNITGGKIYCLAR